MNALFVTEALALIGGGHVMRCLTLAGELARGGADVRFAVNEDAPRFAPSLARTGFSFTTVRTLADAAEIAAQKGGVDAIVCDFGPVSTQKSNARCDRRRPKSS